MVMETIGRVCSPEAVSAMVPGHLSIVLAQPVGVNRFVEASAQGDAAGMGKLMVLHFLMPSR
jgi:hypothetical protein